VGTNFKLKCCIAIDRSQFAAIRLREDMRTMSKQLAISSTFSTFALAAMALLWSPDQVGAHWAETQVPVQAETLTLDLPVPSLFRD